MKVFVARATGAFGRRLVPLLSAAGHEVAGLTRSPAKVGLLRSMGATPVVADALDPSAMMDLLQREKPDAVVFMTDVRGASNAKAKRAFGLILIWPSWRDGFKEGLGDPPQV